MYIDMKKAERIEYKAVVQARVAAREQASLEKYEEWIRERCIEHYQANAGAAELYANFADFCGGRWVESITRWGVVMGRRYERYKSGGRHRYRGLALRYPRRDL